MTNEQLAYFIQQGDNDELIPILWEKVRKLIHMKAKHLYTIYGQSCAAHGVELCDICQAGYLAFLEAIKAYKPESGYKFTTFLKYPFKKAFQDLLNVRTKSGQADPLNNAASLDEPVSDEDGDGCTLLDLQADTNSTLFVECMESAFCSEIIRKEVEALPERQQQVIELYYFDGWTLSQIAAKYNLSIQRITQIRYYAERELRKNKVLQQLYRDHYQQRYRPRRPYFDWQPQYYYLRRFSGYSM